MARTTTPPPAANHKSELGFGFDPAESGHHFVLILPAAGAPVLLEERFGYGEAPDAPRAEPRARVDDYTWGRLAERVQAHFNRRLKDAGRRTGRFEPGENCLAPFLGKELALLLWACDGLDPTDLPNALANWQGFAPEERWWLYTTVKASGGGPEEGRDRGWRKAIRIAFAESPALPPSDGGRGLMIPPRPAAPEPEELELSFTPPSPSPRRRLELQTAIPELFD